MLAPYSTPVAHGPDVSATAEWRRGTDGRTARPLEPIRVMTYLAVMAGCLATSGGSRDKPFERQPTSIPRCPTRGYMSVLLFAKG